MAADWNGLVCDLAIDMAALEYREFVIVEFLAGLAPNPYAQATPEFAGDWYCEVASAHFLPAEAWPLDGLALVSSGWEPPERPGENWARDADTAQAAARLLVEGLRFGRRCQDPGAVVWRTDRFPPRPDDGRGERSPTPTVGPYGLAA
jgi:hypothetical protein